MEGKEVEMDEILLSRERRILIQKQLIAKYNLPVISFTMNIPGPIKTNNAKKDTQGLKSWVNPCGSNCGHYLKERTRVPTTQFPTAERWKPPECPPAMNG